ncbi:MAG: HNH endonuclease [Desulfurellales bacterium]|nr:MAG: HNH endonuclease [Desulfurellales bacterium]
MADHTSIPYFPQDLENYAPWVAKHGLLYPYGDCQCGCGNKTNNARDTYTAKGWQKGKPVRYVLDHRKRQSPYATIEEAFWSHCSPGQPDECWEWQGTLDQDGYGKFTHVKKVRYSAHRFSWELHNGKPVPNGMAVCHNCPGGDNPRCVNPSHLWLGTNRENIADKVTKNRQAKGETNGRALLTKEDVVKIRELHSQKVRLDEIANLFRVSNPTIQKIVYRKNWKHLP